MCILRVEHWGVAGDGHGFLWIIEQSLWMSDIKPTALDDPAHIYECSLWFFLCL